jgi:hypothetical protein
MRCTRGESHLHDQFISNYSSAGRSDLYVTNGHLLTLSVTTCVEVLMINVRPQYINLLSSACAILKNPPAPFCLCYEPPQPHFRSNENFPDLALNMVYIWSQPHPWSRGFIARLSDDQLLRIYDEIVDEVELSPFGRWYGSAILIETGRRIEREIFGHGGTFVRMLGGMSTTAVIEQVVQPNIVLQNALAAPPQAEHINIQLQAPPAQPQITYGWINGIWQQIPVGQAAPVPAVAVITAPLQQLRIEDKPRTALTEEEMRRRARSQVEEEERQKQKVEREKQEAVEKAKEEARREVERKYNSEREYDKKKREEDDVRKMREEYWERKRRDNEEFERKKQNDEFEKKRREEEFEKKKRNDDYERRKREDDIEMKRREGEYERKKQKDEYERKKRELEYERKKQDEERNKSSVEYHQSGSRETHHSSINNYAQSRIEYSKDDRDGRKSDSRDTNRRTNYDKGKQSSYQSTSQNDCDSGSRTNYQATARIEENSSRNVPSINTDYNRSSSTAVPTNNRDKQSYAHTHQHAHSSIQPSTSFKKEKKFDPYYAIGLYQYNKPSDAEIRSAYKTLAFRHHPDQTKDLDQSEKVHSAKRIVGINRAKDILCDQERKRAYDEVGVLEEHEFKAWKVRMLAVTPYKS